VRDEEGKDEVREDDAARWFGPEEVLVITGSGWRPSGGRLPRSTVWRASPSPAAAASSY
jgi:hypothetical protein